VDEVFPTVAAVPQAKAHAQAHIKCIAAGATALQQLNLSADKLTSLRRGGIIASELRGRTTLVYKLRFRVKGKQRVVYLGSDPGFVAEIRTALAALQTPRRTQRRLISMSQAAGRLLQRAKHQLKPHIASSGRSFHGQAIRRRRRAAAQIELHTFSIPKSEPNHESG
jgi:hypothetical protein